MANCRVGRVASAGFLPLVFRTRLNAAHQFRDVQVETLGEHIKRVEAGFLAAVLESVKESDSNAGVFR